MTSGLWKCYACPSCKQDGGLAVTIAARIALSSADDGHQHKLFGNKIDVVDSTPMDCTLCGHSGNAGDFQV